ncbi:unnamed protein product [Ectocarpus sp. 6 AP-2014]
MKLAAQTIKSISAADNQGQRATTSTQAPPKIRKRSCEVCTLVLRSTCAPSLLLASGCPSRSAPRTSIYQMRWMLVHGGTLVFGQHLREPKTAKGRFVCFFGASFELWNYSIYSNRLATHDPYLPTSSVLPSPKASPSKRALPKNLGVLALHNLPPPSLRKEPTIPRGTTRRTNKDEK